jgi:hypothetical protein
MQWLFQIHFTHIAVFCCCWGIVAQSQTIYHAAIYGLYRLRPRLQLSIKKTTVQRVCKTCNIFQRFNEQWNNTEIISMTNTFSDNEYVKRWQFRLPLSLPAAVSASDSLDIAQSMKLMQMVQGPLIDRPPVIVTYTRRVLCVRLHNITQMTYLTIERRHKTRRKRSWNMHNGSADEPASSAYFEKN